MINVIAIILISILVIVALFLIYLWWLSLKQPPAYASIVEKYYVCRKYKILYGGIFGKGPTRKFTSSAGRTWCWRSQWEEIDQKTFKMLATEWYGIDWSEEIPFWHRDMVA